MGDGEENKVIEAEAGDDKKVEPTVTRKEKKKNRKAARKEKKKNRKAARKERKAAKKAAKKASYQALDKKGKRKFRIKQSIIALLILALVITAGWWLSSFVINWGVYLYMGYCATRPVSEEEILEEAPIDQALSDAVDAMESYDPEETWAIYVYLCGSDLESLGINHLSDVTKYLTLEETKKKEEGFQAKRREHFDRFLSEINEQGMDLPSSMYLTPSSEEAKPAMEVSEADPGCASMDLDEMFMVELPENVQIVFQTGGSKRWSQLLVNPNRSQRFVYDSTGLWEVDDDRVQNMGEADTLADFLSFCEEDYPADHKMLLFWNHGAGAFGVAVDELYGHDSLTLNELGQAFDMVYSADEANPPFEVIGFDACLMASAEVAETLHGYGRYLAASEELEPGYGWDYMAWVGELAEHPEMNGAQLGKAITDSYIEYYAQDSIRYSDFGVDMECTFSVVDIAKAHKVYEAYTEFAAAALKDAVVYPGVMAELGRASSRSVRYGANAYDTVNTVDLGMFMKNLSEIYPDETNAVIQALEEAVVYNRATSYGRDSEGLSIYFPTDVKSLSGLKYYLEYLNDICENEDIKALYYYKIAGCLNDELQAYVSSKGYGKAKVLDTTSLEELAEAELVLEEDGNFSMTIDTEAFSLMQDMTFCLIRYDEQEERATYLGEDQFLSMDEDGNLRTEFEGEWMALDGHFLVVEIIDSTESMIKYRTPVSYNGEDSYLILGYDFDAETISIMGVYSMQVLETTADNMMRNVENVEPGAEIRPIYESDNLSDGTTDKEYGKKFTYKANSEVKDCRLDDGIYWELAAFTDSRGDEYYSPIVQFEVQSGEIKSVELVADVQAVMSAE